MRKKEGVEAAAAVSGGETEAQRKQREAFERVLSFAKLLRYPLWDVNDQSTKSTPRYTRYTKEDLMDYMQSPATNEANIRNARVRLFWGRTFGRAFGTSLKTQISSRRFCFR